MTTFDPGARLVFTQGLRVQAALDRFFREQSGAQHQRRIRSVGAAGDRGDDHDRAIGRSKLSPLFFTCDCAFARVPVRCAFGEGRFRLAQRHAVLRTLGTGERGLDGGEIEFERVGENRIGRRVGAENALQLRVSVDQGDTLGAAAGEAQVGQRFGIHREEAHRGAVFGSHVGDGGAVGKREARKPGAVELDELSRRRLFCAASA